MIRFIQEEFGIFPVQTLKIRQYDGFYDGHFFYIMIKVYEQEQEELQERFEMTNYLRHYGEKFVPIFFAAKDGNFVKRLNDDYYTVLKLEQWRNKPYQYPGSRLANFHRHGSNFRSEKNALNRLGQWKKLWEVRISRLEKFWQQIVINRPMNEFERYFTESFPYYAGITENAIQYFVDTTMDEQPGAFDVPTICHERFTKETWAGPMILKDPFDWIVDHHSRDLAEWTRFLFITQPQMYQNEVQKFYREYEVHNPLSPFSWRLQFSRLVLPIHYFQCIETYYSHLADELDHKMLHRLKDLLNNSSEYERFLADFYEMAGAPVRTLNLPTLDWLM